MAIFNNGVDSLILLKKAVVEFFDLEGLYSLVKVRQRVEVVTPTIVIHGEASVLFGLLDFVLLIAN